jgi:hypothetical protein
MSRMHPTIYCTWSWFRSRILCKRNNGAPQFVGMRTNGNNLQIGAYDMYNGEKYDARKALDTGVATHGRTLVP